MPISQLSDSWDKTKENVLDSSWKKRVESKENEIQQDDIKIKSINKNNKEGKTNFPSFKR